MGKVVSISNVRLAFAHLHNPRERTFDDGKTKSSYEATFILDPLKNAADVAAIEAACFEVAKEVWGDEAINMLKNLVGTDKVGFRKRDNVSAKTGKVYEGFEGMYYVGTSASKKPTLVNQAATAFLVESDNKPYSGCMVNAKIEAWVQKPVSGRPARINFAVQGVQFVGDNEAFAGAGTVATLSDFAPVAGATPAAPSASSVFG